MNPDNQNCSKGGDKSCDTSDDNNGQTTQRLWGGEGSIVVFAKCPIPGKSKTRLIPLLGEEGSVRLAKGMLSDVLKTIDGCPKLSSVRKILVYAPGTPEGRETMEDILNELDLTIKKDSNEIDDAFDAWHLLPMMSKTNDLRSNDLGVKLEDALVRVRKLEGENSKHGVVFLGMDAPILPLEDIVAGLERATEHEAATLCPARDGGYAMLCVPHTAVPSWTFGDMYWSHPWTGMSQAKAITDQGIQLYIGTVVRDIDETSDVEELSRHLGITSSQATDGGNSILAKKNLELPSGRPPWLLLDFKEVASSHPTCHFTRKALEITMGSPRSIP